MVWSPTHLTGLILVIHVILPEFFSGIVMAIMTSDQIYNLGVAIPNSSELIHLSHRMSLWSFEEFRGVSFC